MKRILTIMVFSCVINGLGTFANAAVKNSPPISMETNCILSKTETVTIVGTVMLKGGSWVIYGIDSRNGEAQDYYPKNLKQAYKIEGQKVKVEATLDPIPENVRFVGAPITIVRFYLL